MFSSPSQPGSSVSALVTFGIPELDQSLGGGIQRGAVFIVEDRLGADAQPFLTQFIVQGLKTMDYVYVLNTDMPYEYYEEYFKLNGVNPDMHVRTGRLKFVDAFSNPSGYESRIQEFSEPLRDISSPRDANEAIRRAMLHTRNQKVGVRGAVISLSSIINAAESPRHVHSFVRQRLAADHYEGWTSLLQVHTDAHDPVFIRSIEHLVDGVLRVDQTKTEDGRHAVSVQVLHVKGKPELAGATTYYTIQSGVVKSLTM